MGRDAMRRFYAETGAHCIGMQRFDVYGMQRMDARGRDAMHRVSTLNANANANVETHAHAQTVHRISTQMKKQ